MKRRKLKKKVTRKLFSLLISIITIIVLVIVFSYFNNDNDGYVKLENEVSEAVKMLDNNTLNINNLETKYNTNITKNKKLEKEIESYLLDIIKVLKDVNEVKFDDKLELNIKSLKNISELNDYYNSTLDILRNSKTKLEKIKIEDYVHSTADVSIAENIVEKLDKNKYISDIDNLIDNIIFKEEITKFLIDNSNAYSIDDEIIFNDKKKYNEFKDLLGDKDIFKYSLKENTNSINSNTSNNNKMKYYTEVIRNQNTVIVYGLDDNNNYTKVVKVFPCSVGLNDATPTGTFKTSDKYVWRALFGNVYGQYATRVNGHILFHSVPYTKQSNDSLEWEEYNKLGTAASMGCIRMRVSDVKWIYDNCDSGMSVKIYDGNLPDGVEKPTITKIDINSPNRGWDPTDPNSNNPWN